MRIAVLGPLEVLSDERAPIALPGAKERLLLAVLAADAPAVVAHIKAMAETCPDTLTGKRDRALLLLGFGGAFRCFGGLAGCCGFF